MNQSGENDILEGWVRRSGAHGIVERSGVVMWRGQWGATARALSLAHNSGLRLKLSACQACTCVHWGQLTISGITSMRWKLECQPWGDRDSDHSCSSVTLRMMTYENIYKGENRGI